MIGKPEWFSRRKYTGWGFTPKTWQGWVYILVMILPPILITNTQALGTSQSIFLVLWFIVFCVDFVDIALHLKKDERDRIHEAIAERNAMWAILAVLGGGIAYQSAMSVASQGKSGIDPVIFVALAAALAVKIISNIYLDKKD